MRSAFSQVATLGRGCPGRSGPSPAARRAPPARARSSRPTGRGRGRPGRGRRAARGLGAAAVVVIAAVVVLVLLVVAPPGGARHGARERGVAHEGVVLRRARDRRRGPARAPPGRRERAVRASGQCAGEAQPPHRADATLAAEAGRAPASPLASREGPRVADEHLSPAVCRAPRGLRLLGSPRAAAGRRGRRHAHQADVQRHQEDRQRPARRSTSRSTPRGRRSSASR